MMKNLSFSEALFQLEKGKRMMRSQWDNEFVALNWNEEKEYGSPYFYMSNDKEKNPDKCSVWLPSMADILSKEWMAWEG